jgi:hypothetical protein
LLPLGRREAQFLRIYDEVEFGDAAVGDRDPKNADGPPAGSDDQPRRAVDDGGPAVGQEGGAVREHLLCHLGGAVNAAR